MSYWVIKSNNTSMVKEFQCDFLSDIGKLPTHLRIGARQKDDNRSNNPCAPGSSCLCYEDGSEWLLGMETDTWIKMGSKYGCIGSGNSGNTPGSTITSYDQLKDTPMVNIKGEESNPPILSELTPDIYKIKGSFRITDDSEIMSSYGGIFIVSETGTVLEILPDGLYLITIFANGTYTTNRYQTENDISKEVLKQMDGDEFNTKINGIIQDKFGEITDDDIESLF